MSRLDKFEEILKSYEERELELVSPVSYNGLEWQPRAYRKLDRAKALVFDESQAKLVQEGYERHPLSAEAYDLIIAHLEGKLPPKLDKMAEDMLTGGFGEFFCQAVETARVSDRIVARIYEHVIVLPRNAADNCYEKAGMKYSKAKTFEITDLELGTYNHYKNIYVKHNALIEYLTSRKYENLPDKIKEKGKIGLPEPGRIWPIGLGFIGEFYVIGSVGIGASRGVRSPQKNSKENTGLGT